MPSAVVESESEHKTRTAKIVDQHIIEIVSDSGEAAQTCGQMFADICARNGNGLWAGQIIPAEIEPPSRSPSGANANCILPASNRFTHAPSNPTLASPSHAQTLSP